MTVTCNCNACRLVRGEEPGDPAIVCMLGMVDIVVRDKTGAVTFDNRCSDCTYTAVAQIFCPRCLPKTASAAPTVWGFTGEITRSSLFLISASVTQLSEIARIDADGRPWVAPGVTSEQIVRNIADVQGLVTGNQFVISDDGPREIARINYDGTVTIAPNVTSDEILLVVYKCSLRLLDHLPADQHWRRWQYTGPYATDQAIRCPTCQKRWRQTVTTTVPPITAQCPDCEPNASMRAGGEFV